MVRARSEDALEKMTDKLVRFSVAMPESLFSEFEQRVRRSGRKNRSEALRFLVRRYLAEERWRGDEGEVYGTVTLVYDHHTSGLTRGLTEAQHRGLVEDSGLHRGPGAHPGHQEPGVGHHVGGLGVFLPLQQVRPQRDPGPRLHQADVQVHRQHGPPRIA